MKRTQGSQLLSKSQKIIISALIGLILIISLYSIRSFHFKAHFLPGTTINNIAVGNKTVAEANDLLKKQTATNTFTVTLNGKKWHSYKQQTDSANANYTAELQQVKTKQNAFNWGPALFNKQKATITNTALDQTKLASSLATMQNQITELNTTRKPTSDASITSIDNKLTVTKEVQGDAIDTTAVIKAATKKINSGEKTLELTDYLQTPTVKKNSSVITKAEKKILALSKIKANYTISGQTVPISQDTLLSFLTYQNGDVTVDSAKVKEYVTNLGTTYNTNGANTSFNSTKRGTVEVPSGTYNWSISVDDETKALSDAILAGKDFTRTPITSGSAPADTPLIGKTYVEVDLVNQHMWVYKDGSSVLDTPIISGKPASPTPAGVFYVWSKEQNATLRGTNDDGSAYASPVSYWMPVDWTGVGIHDSPWQKSNAYGGDSHLTVGSHGCVNTPPSVMGQVYQLVDEKTPVIIF